MLCSFPFAGPVGDWRREGDAIPRGTLGHDSFKAQCGGPTAASFSLNLVGGRRNGEQVGDVRKRPRNRRSERVRERASEQARHRWNVEQVERGEESVVYRLANNIRHTHWSRWRISAPWAAEKRCAPRSVRMHARA